MPFKIKRHKKNGGPQSDPFSFIKRNPFYYQYALKFKNLNEAIFISFMAFLCGLFLGIVAGQNSEYLKTQASSHRRGPGLMQKMFAPVISVPGMQTDGSFLFSSFEAAIDFKAWMAESAHMEISPAHASEETHSARVKFLATSGLSGILMESYFESRYAFSDWVGFRALSFHIYNPASTEIKLIFQIKDKAGRRFKKEITAPPGRGIDYEISIEEAAREINIRNIRQITLFAWKNASDHEIYFDNVRLVL